MNLRRSASLTVTAAAVGVLLAGCSDNGDDFGDFTTFRDAIEPDNRTEIAGDARTTTFESDVFTGGVDLTTAVTDEEPAVLALEFDENAEFQSISVSGTSAPVVIDEDADDVIIDRGEIISGFSANGEDVVRLGDPRTLGFDHQTFGAWVTGFGTNSGAAGVGSFGNATDSGDVPVTGTARYDGASAGLFVADDGTAFTTTSDFAAIADFEQRDVNVFTSETEGTELATGLRADLRELNMAGTLDFSGAGDFAGDVETVSGLTGQATGEFFGPEAEEIGGTFATTGGGSTFTGAFGGAR